jgi:hypothetical protein
MSRVSKNSVKSVVEECGRLYNFDSGEALRLLGVESNVKVNVKSKYPMPFDGVKKEGYCNGIVKNHGLYTQCEKKVKEGSCKGCEKKPYGSIEDRIAVDLYDYKDPKGKSPKRYTEVLKKLNISKETIEKEAERLNIKIAEVHFEEVDVDVKRGRPKTEKKVKDVTGKKGRPKKEKKTVAIITSEEEDLFASLIAKANAANAEEVAEEVAEESKEEVAEEVAEESKEEVAEESKEEVAEESKEESKEALPKVDKKEKKVKEVDPAKEAEKQKKAEEKAAKEAEKQKKAEEKAAKEAEKEAEKQKKAEEKAAKEAEKQKKAEEKAAKEAEKQKKAEEKAAKEAEKQKKGEEKAAKEGEKVTKEAEKEEADVVRKFEHEGKSYYKSKNTGVIYNMEQEVVGKWNEERKEIEFEEEEEEEEYDE